MRLLRHNRWRLDSVARLLCGLALCASLFATAACQFDAARNPAYGCDECKPPDRCVHGFCVWFDAPPPPADRDTGGPDTGPPPRIDASAGGTCQEPSLSVAERCNGSDDDCDGEIDEDFAFASDPLNCGGCGVSCPDEQTCCAGFCVDPSSNADHCGACGVRCPRGTGCCGGACVDTTSDPDNCGQCGTGCTGATGCCSGQCVDTQIDRDHCGPLCLRCAEGEACCSGACADLGTFKHCGSCARACALGELCCSGRCTAGECE